MNLQTIEMDKGEALERFREYRDSVRDRHDAETAQIMAGYRELARGRTLINLPDVIEAGGMRQVEYKSWWGGMQSVPAPNLAICLADEQWCTYAMREGSVTFCGYRDDDGERNYYAWQHRSRLRRVRSAISGGASVSEGELHAMVPMVPAPLRPKAHLRNFHILWEVDEWAPRVPPVPRDPALLKRIGGDLFAVLAVWDLTDLERAVLGGRRG